jgi:hypothetical protein
MFRISPYKTFDKCSLSNLFRKQNPGGCLLQGGQQQQRQLAEAPRAYDLPSEHGVSSPTSKQRVSISQLRWKESTSVDRRAIFAAFLPLAIENALGLLPFLFGAPFILAFFFSAFAPEWGAR